MGTSYHTQQKRSLLGFLEENAAEQFTIDEMLRALGEDAPGKSSAYRIMKKLCDEGRCRRFTRPGESACVYQLSGKSCCSEHLHIKCLACGKLLHLSSEAQDELSRLTGFVIDDERSMLFGRCESCAGRAK